MAEPQSIEVFPPEYQRFLDGVKELLDRYPGADKRFAIADLGNADAKARLAGRNPDWNCVSTQWGVVCKPFSPEV